VCDYVRGVSSFVYVSMHVCVCVCMYVHMCVRVCTCMYICVCVCLIATLSGEHCSFFVKSYPFQKLYNLSF